ncbi:CocE/NonD family hydrolase [Kordiimonas sp.]|uniref:CocE/NonD family hydrolase n=1 Tax=Kordiimonas sp. TaxID=1970157 RepID=UPI003A8E759F
MNEDPCDDVAVNADKKNYEERLAAWQKAQFAPPPEPPLSPLQPSLVEQVPMRDGVCLYTEIFLPPDAALGAAGSDMAEDQAAEPCAPREPHLKGTFPVLLCRSPYPYSRFSRSGGKGNIPQFLAAGYAVVFQFTRGQGRSEGQFRRYKDDGYDGYDTVQWLAEQPWSNGRVGMLGGSYCGVVQLLAAKAKPPALKCIMPTAFGGNFTESFPFANGVLKKGPFLQWLQVVDSERTDDTDTRYCDMSALNHPKWGAAFRSRPTINAADTLFSGDKLVCYRDTVSNPMDNDFWKDVHFTDADLAALDIPIFITDGWYDSTVGPVDFFTRLERLQPNRDDRFLLVGPWNHAQTQVPAEPGFDDGDRIYPEKGAVDFLALRLAFFNRYLKDEAKDKRGGGQQEGAHAPIQEDRVKVYIAGSPGSRANDWFHFPTFPAPGTELRPLYLHSRGDARSFPGDGVLSWEQPGEEPTDQYIYDPSVPTNSISRSYKDRRPVEVRSDVLTYTSAPLSRPLTILGDITLKLYAASDCLDTDWFAIITEVFPDGQSKSFHYAPTAYRARYREGMDREVLLTPDKPEEFTIPMGPAGHQIAAGHRIRLSLFSAAFPEYEPNTNTGNPAATDTEMQIARQTIYHDRVRPSHILLPVIELP